MSESGASAKRRLSVQIQVTVPVRVPATASMRQALETVPESESPESVTLRSLLLRAWRVATGETGRARASWRDDMVTSVLSFFLGVGLFLDGWNHINLQEGKLGPFLTPWHYGLYTGFTATAVWVLTRNQKRHGWSLANIPRGYGAALIGMGFAGVAISGDAVWHTVFGVETGITRVISPFHLFLFLAGFLLVSTSFRSAWQAETPATIDRFKTFFPALLSISVATALISYFFQYASPMLTWTPESVLKLANSSAFLETTQIYQVLSVLVTNLILVSPIIFILRRWQPPYGTCAVLFGVVAGFSASMTEFSRLGLVAAAVAGGLVGDLAIARLRPSPQRRAATRAVGAIVPAALWACEFTALRLAYNITWSPELWLGSITLATLTGVGLTVLTVPQHLPISAWNSSKGLEDQSTTVEAPTTHSSSDADVIPFQRSASAPAAEHQDARTAVSMEQSQEEMTAEAV